MGESKSVPESPAPWQALLGYLNFSEGRPDPRFQKNLDDAYQFAVRKNAADPIRVLGESLRFHLKELHAQGASAFRDIRQADAVVRQVFDRLLPAYRTFHADILAHQSDAFLFQPYFLARVFEAALAQAPPWDEDERITKGALARINDFTGYRPVAVLETKPRGETYPHERVRPIPLYLSGAGVAQGRYHDLVHEALEILRVTDPDILADAMFDPQLLDEFAVDPRAYDHAHPANRRPTHFFGEWDPHHVDHQGRYRRFVVRQLTLDALLDRLASPGARDPGELLREGAGVLAGVILMASGICGSGPTAHDSGSTLSVLQPRVAKNRDRFYRALIEKLTGPLGDKLREEAKRTRQPFGSARQHLNHFMAQHRAAQQQERLLAMRFAEMGNPAASHERSARIAPHSARMLCELLSRLSLADIQADRGELARSADLLTEAEDILRRGIDCGAFVDPWNILGFGGLFPLSPAREDAIRDPRIDELLQALERLFDLYARLLGESAAAGNKPLGHTLQTRMRRLARWWDTFASVTIADVRRVQGGEATQAAEQVAGALAQWHAQGEASADLAFWRQHAREFQSPRAFARVVDTLLRKRDHRAALALLMSWLSQSEHVPLEEGPFSFHGLVVRWLVSATDEKAPADPDLIRKFFDYQEANAEENWEVPQLEQEDKEGEQGTADDEDDIYKAAYEGMTYHDSAEDGQEGSLADDEPPPAKEFDLEEQSPHLQKRLRFLATIAQLWQMGARLVLFRSGKSSPEWREAGSAWLARAQANRERMLSLLDAIQRRVIPKPLGSVDAVVEYDRRRGIKEHLLGVGIGAALETTLAVFSLKVALPETDQPSGETPAWETGAVLLERALLAGDSGEAAKALPGFLQLFQAEPLLFVPLSAGGHPVRILRTHVAHTVLQTLLANLPRLGLLRETYHHLRAIRAMEQAQPPEGNQRLTDFDRLFGLAFGGVLESIAESARTWDAANSEAQALVQLMETITKPFFLQWKEYTDSTNLQGSSLEKIPSAEEWEKLGEFVKKYGRDIFHTRFLAVEANLRGILHQGVAAWLDQLAEQADPLKPNRLVEDLDKGIKREDAIRYLEWVLQGLVENYKEFLDFNQTTPQSDYGENLIILLDFLRLKASYDLQAWINRPLVLVHEVLVRHGWDQAAALWEKALTDVSQKAAEQHLEELSRLEQKHGIRLRSVADRIAEKFVKPLALDRLCLAVAPAMEEVRQGDPGPAWAKFEQELHVHAAMPVGSGLDAPFWLERLQFEVRRIRTEQSGSPGSARKQFLAPRTLLTFQQVQEQINGWDKLLPAE